MYRQQIKIVKSLVLKQYRALDTPIGDIRQRQGRR